MWLFYGILASAIWASGDDVNSLLVKRYEKNPILLSWFQSVVGLVILTMFAMAFDVRSQHVPLLILGGIIAYGGYLFFLHVLQHVDVSVSTAAWAMLAIFMSIAGFLLFGDRWSLLQGVGVALVLLGVFILAYWYQHVSVPRTLAMFSILGLLYVPFYVAQKTALIAGDPVTAVFFWPLFAELVCAFTLPWCIPMYRRNLLAFHPQVSRGFLALNVYSILASLTGFYAFTKAYQLGMASLVAMTENAMPFFAILFAWLIANLAPNYAPRELLTTQSVQVKLVSFGIVFAGLSLLAIG